MILFRGNCQMQFCAEAAQEAGLDASFASLASPMTLARSPGHVPPLLEKMLAATGAGEYLHTRELVDQFLPPPANPRPEALVINLFHENRPLFLHNEEGYVFYLDPEALSAVPALGRFINHHFRSIVPTPATYLDRLATMLLHFRAALPGVPLLVVGRMSHYPGLGPDPYSYLEGWDTACFTMGKDFAAWVNSLPGTFFLDTDRIMAGVLCQSGGPVEAHFPFLRIRSASPGASLKLSRDLEHSGGLWPAVVTTIRTILATGSLRYSAEQTVPAAWEHPFTPEMLTDSQILEHLVSGSNYRAARAVGQFFFRPEVGFTDRLVMAAPYMPVCHNLLHMVRAYATWKPNRTLARWCEAHAARAQTFTANGEAYRQEYLQKIEETRQSLLASELD